jgi:hypothetical protein
MSRLKKKGVGIDIPSIACIIAFIIGFSWCASTESTYKIDGRIVGIENGIISVDDVRGENWEFYGNEFYVGQEVTLVMDDNHTTSNIYDDWIKKVLTK